MQEKIKRFLKVNKINEKQALIKFDKMAMKIAKQYSGKNEFDDLYQVAKIGIIEAVRTYKPEKASLSTHVFNMILSNVRKLVLKESNLIYIPPYVKQEIKDVMVDIESFDIADTNTDFTKYIIFNEIFNQLLYPLTTKQREVIKFKYLEGLTVAEIAKVMGCSHQNVSSVCKSAEKAIFKVATSGELSFM
jgi:RNA polymerase sigma factor (sigma-70 family)